MSDEFFRRLKQYARPADKSWWHGEHTPENIKRWQAYATENSQLAPRAKDGPIDLPDTGKDGAARHIDEAISQEKCRCDHEGRESRSEP